LSLKRLCWLSLSCRILFCDYKLSFWSCSFRAWDDSLGSSARWFKFFKYSHELFLGIKASSPFGFSRLYLLFWLPLNLLLDNRFCYDWFSSFDLIFNDRCDRFYRLDLSNYILFYRCIFKWGFFVKSIWLSFSKASCV